MARKLMTVMVVLCLLCYGTVAIASDDFDLSRLSYDELVSLKEQINLAIWNSAEWEEVEVPQGVYQVGLDIPEGHWTIICAKDWYRTSVSWGERLSDTGEDIAYKGRYSMGNYIYNQNHKSYKKGNGVTEYSCEVRNGEYIVIDYGAAIFTPYAAKPGFSFKSFRNDDSDNTTPATSEPKKEDVQTIISTILACKNSETEKAWKLIQENADRMNERQLEECLISYGRWKSLESAETEIKSMLKSPRSFYRYGGSIEIPTKQEDGSYKVAVTVEYGATNSFGAEVTDKVTVYVCFEIDIESIEVTFTQSELSAYDKWRLR